MTTIIQWEDPTTGGTDYAEQEQKQWVDIFGTCCGALARRITLHMEAQRRADQEMGMNLTDQERMGGEEDEYFMMEEEQQQDNDRA